MRIHLNIFADKKIVPYDHQHLLTGTIHKWIGTNNEHGKLSLYSFSRFENAKATNEGLRFGYTTSIFFSTYNNDLLKKMISGIQKDPNMFNGLRVNEVIIQEDPDFTRRNLFFVASPIFIKRRWDERIEHILYNDLRANNCLKETLMNKMSVVGLIDDTLEIQFDNSYSRAVTKKITYNGIENKASWCPVFIKGKPETKLFAWNVGLGNSTGIGFGAIK